jgi:hypothetical protein
VKVNRVDEKTALDIAEGDVADQACDEGFEGLAAIERGRKKAAEGHVGAGHLEDVTPPDLKSSGLHLAGGYPSRPSRRDERADAGAYYQARHQPALFQSPQDANVGEPFQATATQDQGKGAVGYHALALPKVALRTSYVKSARIVRSRAVTTEPGGLCGTHQLKA